MYRSSHNTRENKERKAKFPIEAEGDQNCVDEVNFGTQTQTCINSERQYVMVWKKSEHTSNLAQLQLETQGTTETI